MDDSLPGRAISTVDNDTPDMNGSDFFKKKYLEHVNQYAIVIIALGINDLKLGYEKTGSDVADELHKLAQLIKKTSQSTDVIIPLPPTITKEDGFGSDFSGAAKKSKELKQCLIKASKNNAFQLLIMDYELNTIDGIHFSLNENKNIAKNLKEHILTECVQ